MLLPEVLSITAVILLILLVGLVAGVAYKLYVSEKRLDMEKGQTGDSQKIMLEAREQSEKIVRDAYYKAWQIVNEAKGVDESVKKLLTDITAKMEGGLTETAGQILTRTESEMALKMDKVSEQMKEIGVTKLNEVFDSLEKEMSQSSREIVSKIDEKSASVDAELEKYREKKMQEIDLKVKNIVSQAAKEIIGRSISADVHDELVIKAIEKAKEGHVF